MSSSKSSQEHSKKASGDEERLGFDLLYQLSHLSAVAAAGIPRNQLFRIAGELPCSTAAYFSEIDRIAQNLNYQYAEACRIVGESAKSQVVKSLLLRLASSLATGEELMDFMSREAQVQAEAYGNIYEGRLESLKKWTDAYVAMQVSVALIVVVAAISTVIYNMGTGFVVGLVVVMAGISALASWIIYRTAPRESKTLNGLEGHKSQRIPRLFFIGLFPATLVVGTLMSVVGAPLSFIMMVAGVMLAPIGFVAWRLDRAVNQADSEMSTFLRTLGSTASAIQTTPADAMERMDLRSTGAISQKVEQLHTALRSRINPTLCWMRFVADTGSELISRGAHIFLDGINLGGDPEEIGDRASLLTTKVSFLRAKRRLVASSFGWLALIMHAVIVFLLVFVVQIVAGFGKMVQLAGASDLASGSGPELSSLLSFNFENMEFIQWLLVPVVLFLCVINAVTPKIAEGSYIHKVFLYMSVTLFTAGLAWEAGPKLAGTMFNMAPI